MPTPTASHLFNWTDTTLWRLLRDSTETESDRIRTTLQAEMPQIQSILTQGGTSPLDFTLHDAQHSYRVAQRMADIIPASTVKTLSPYELALLLLSAYLHDIGMTPSQALIDQIRTYILFGTGDLLHKSIINSFQIWSESLESEAKEVLTKRPISSPKDIRVADRITALFCRHRHVELSEQWIDTHFKDCSLGSYVQWATDLKLLCRSHNEGFEFLAGKQMDPKPVGTPGYVVHLRYLACVLRVADVLEFDPERTPEVIFSHRDVAPGSEIYWFKDHYPTLTIEKGQLTISANPPDAKIHRAIELMCDDIEAELRLVSRINDDFPFTTLPFQSKAGCHEWALSSNLRRHLSPLNGRYQYIDGAFRPDTHKVLQLLSGKRLYKHEYVSIRELLQNSFDAVRERIALERLTKSHPEDSEWNDRLSNIYSVTLDLQTDQDKRVWIVCTDDGVGMSQGIIMNYLLVSGMSQRQDLWQLGRRCREKGFELERTGQFGIGVLSYFMIADFVRFETRRNPLCSDAERNGWIFETEGIGSFGELRSYEMTHHLGTRVSLRLRPEVAAEMSIETSSANPRSDFSRFGGHAVDSRYPRIVDYLLRGPNKTEGMLF